MGLRGPGGLMVRIPLAVVLNLKRRKRVKKEAKIKKNRRGLVPYVCVPKGDGVTVDSGRDGGEVGRVLPVGSSRTPGQRSPHSRNGSPHHPIVSGSGEKELTGVGAGVVRQGLQ